MDGRLAIFAGKYPLIKSLHSRGVEVVNFHYPNYMDRRTSELCKALVYCDLSNTDEVCDFAKGFLKKENILGAYSQNEYGLLSASLINESFGLKRNFNDSRAIANTRDKGLFRQLVKLATDRNADLNVFAICRTHSDILKFFEEARSVSSNGIILKPRGGVGSLGVCRMTSASEINALFVPEEGFLAEIFIEGAQYSVETFSFNGVHKLVCINLEINGGQDAVNPYVQIGHCLPIHLPRQDAASIKNRVFDALDKVGVTHGPSHTEIVVNSNDIFVLEVNTRPGSSPLPDLLQAVTGVDFYRLMFDWFIGVAKPQEFGLLGGIGAAVRHIVLPPGRIRAISGIRRAENSTGITSVVMKCAPGSIIPPLRSAFDRVGYITAIGHSASDAFQNCCNAINELHFKIE